MPHIPLNSLQVDALPSAEDDSFEYKSSRTPLPKLKDKINRAASAFANSGGGCFVAGVDGGGTPDGGIASVVSRQSLRDWVDQAIAMVSPRVEYQVQQFSDCHGKGQLSAGHVVLAISFPASASSPHMAYDHVYYIRAGAHTVPAPSVVVESLWAHRASTRPLLTHAVRERPGAQDVVQIGVVALNQVPALDVQFNVEPRLGLLNGLDKYFPIRLPVVDRDTPFFLDITLFHRYLQDLPAEVVITIKYRDVAGNEYFYRSERPLMEAVTPIHIGTAPAERIAKAIDSLAQKVDRRTPFLQTRGN